MTNYGALTILALPRLQNARMAPGEAELRLMLALETWQPNGRGERTIGTRRLAELAGVNQKTVLRARDRLVKAGRIECEPGTGTARSTWRFTFPSAPTQDGVTKGASGPTQDGSTSGGVDINMGSLAPDPGPASDPNPAASGPIQAGSTLLSYDMNRGAVTAPPDRASARPDDEAQPDYRRGPVIEGRVVTGRGPVRPPPRSADPEIAKSGAELARAAMAARPGAEAAAEPARPRTEDEWQALARRQAHAARSARGEPVSPNGQAADESAPLWQEEDPDDEPPF